MPILQQVSEPAQVEVERAAPKSVHFAHDLEVARLPLDKGDLEATLPRWTLVGLGPQQFFLATV